MPYASNTFKAKDAALLTAALTSQEMILSSLVSRNLNDDLLGGGGKNRTVNIKVPTALVAHARGIDDVTNAIIMDTITETTVPLTLGVHAYSAVPLSEGDLTLNLTDFGAQVLDPQAKAVASYCEAAVLNVLQSLTSSATADSVAYDPANPAKFFTAIRRDLRKSGVPATDLNVVVGTDVFFDLVNANALRDVSQSGSSEALREAQVGRVAGMTVVENTEVSPDEIIAFHREAFTLAMRAPITPAGASFGAKVTEAGVQIRYLRDYDPTYAADRSLLSTFVGVKAMPLYKITRTQDNIGAGTQADPRAIQGATDPDGAGALTAYTVGSATVTAVSGGAARRYIVTAG